MMPEMSGSKCTNGISWLLYETPMLMLDESIRCFEISREGMDSSSLDLVTTRAFVCPLPLGSNLESPSVKINPPPEPFEAPSSKDLSSEDKPKFRRRAPRYASPKLPKRTNISDTSQGGTRIDFDKCPTSSNTQKAEDASTGSYSGRAAGLDENKISPPSLSNINSPSSIIADPMSSLCLPSALTLSVPAITRSIPRFLSSSIPDNSKLIKFESASASIDNFLDKSNSGTWRALVIPPRDASAISVPSKPNNVIATSENPGPHQSASETSISTRQFHQLHALPMNTAGSLDGGDMNIEREFSQKLPPKMHLRHLFNQSTYPNHRDGPQSLLSDMKKDVPQTSMPALPSEKMLAMNDAKLLTGAEDANAQGSSIMIGEDGNAMNLVASDRTQPALIDSYLFGRPLTIIISNRRLKDHWSLQFPEEFGYAMLGYFRILGVQETRLQVDDNKGSVNELRQSLSGQVQWRFRLKWAAGGEESILPKRDNVNFDHPWWNPPSVLPASTSGVEQAPEENVPETALDDLDDPENSFPTTARYRTARLSHHEYNELYSSVIPLHLLVPYGVQVIDNSFPRGWFCKDCGRMNFQAALRHRKCPSSFCKDKQPSVPPYARDLIWIRDPQERLPLSAPLNVIPRSLPTKLGKFKDGTQTFSYYISERPSIFIKHIFTSNIPRLQEHANIFLRDIQLNVPLIRPMAENSAYSRKSSLFF
ncbi:hypothetical protein BDZ97DRAFT_1837174 [Flammula alnicola]|nr:hypothetical protein BDZ97DRAFT_1837174 [Flammula alnicola]